MRCLSINYLIISFPDVGKERVNVKKRIMNSIQKETFFKNKKTITSSSLLLSEVTLPSKDSTDLTQSKDVNHTINEDSKHDLLQEVAASTNNQSFNIFECSKYMLVKLRDCFKKKKKNTSRLSKNEGKEKLNPN